MFRGLLAAVGVPAGTATVAHGAVMWGSEQVVLPALGVAPPLTRWGWREVLIDAWHHLVHVAGTLAAYRFLSSAGRR